MEKKRYLLIGIHLLGSAGRNTAEMVTLAHRQDREGPFLSACCLVRVSICLCTVCLERLCGPSLRQTSILRLSLTSQPPNVEEYLFSLPFPASPASNHYSMLGRESEMGDGGFPTCDRHGFLASPARQSSCSSTVRASHIEKATSPSPLCSRTTSGCYCICSGTSDFG